MSFSGNDARKARVAHQSSHNSAVLQSLEKKRQCLAEIAAKVSCSKTTSPKKNPFKGTTAKKSKRKVESEEEEEEDFIDDDDVSEEDDFHSDDEPPKRKKPSKAPASSTVKKPPTVIIKQPVKTLDDSSDDEVWLSKPSVNAKKMETKKASAPKLRKVIAQLSDDSDEDDTKSPFTLKKVAKSAQKEKRKATGSDSEEEYLDDEGGFSDDHRESTPPSEDSDADERRSSRPRKENYIAVQCREFFNAATQEELLATPRVTEKISLAIIGSRPFETFYELEDCLKEITRGKVFLEAYKEHLENRGVLERILDDCRVHAQSTADDFERCTQGKNQPSLLTEGYILHDYQQVGLNWLIMMHRKGFNCILGDEMGLGKTIQIIAFLAWMKENRVAGPHLIVVPSSTIENWMGELARWAPSLKLLTYYGSQDERKQLRHMAKKKKDNIDIVLTTYNMISSKSDDKKFFKNFSMHYVIYDEGHMLKNCSTDRYKNLMKVRGQRKILLTGTPLQNNLIELISLMYFVMTRVFNKYCEDIAQLLLHFKQQGPALEASNAQMYQNDRIEQAKQILQPYILRRLKVNVLSNLPQKHEKIVEVEMLPEQNENYENILDLSRNEEGETSNAYGALMRLRQAANHPLLRRVQYDDRILDKIAKVLVAKERAYETKQVEHVAEDLSYLSDFQIHQLCEKFSSTKKFLLDESLVLESGKCKELDRRLPEIIAKGEKLLIFSQFTSMLDILEVFLKIRNYKFRRLDGQTPVMERQEMINEFNCSDDLFVFLLSTKAGGLGINLTSANHIIIHDIDFNPYNDKQAEDRCHRMGQKREVFVTRLISKGTVETGMWMLAQKKLRLEKQVTIGIKGQADDDENTRDSNEAEEKLDTKVLQDLLSSAMKRKSLDEMTPSPQ